jgi:hypothetical protein
LQKDNPWLMRHSYRTLCQLHLRQMICFCLLHQQ